MSETLDPFDVQFDANLPPGLTDPSGWSVTGSAGSRTLRDPSGQKYAEETTTEAAPHTNGGSLPGVSIVRKFPFAYNTPDLLTGAALYVPTVGDILYDAWLEIVTAWDGTTPTGSIGILEEIQATGVSFFGQAPLGANPDMTIADTSTVGVLNNAEGAGAAPTLLSVANFWSGGSLDYQRVVPAKFVSASPVSVYVSQNSNPGGHGGLDPGSAQGAAVLYLVTATPA